MCYSLTSEMERRRAYIGDFFWYILVIMATVFILAYYVSACIFFQERYAEVLASRESDKNFHRDMCADAKKQITHNTTRECEIRSHRLLEAFWLHPLSETLHEYGLGSILCGKNGCTGIIGTILTLVIGAVLLVVFNLLVFSKCKKNTIHRVLNSAREGESVV